jgi:cell cycle protein kinase DBF2
MAPEVLHGTPYDHTVDYWSLGCMLFETLVGYPPFAGQTPDDTWLNLRHWKKVLVRPVFERGSGDEEFNLQDHAWEFITRCITERKDRYQTIEQVMQDKYFTMVIDDTPALDWERIRKTPVTPLLCECNLVASFCARFGERGRCWIF